MQEIIGAYQVDGKLCGMDAFQQEEIAKFPAGKPLRISVDECIEILMHHR